MGPEEKDKKMQLPGLSKRREISAHVGCGLPHIGAHEIFQVTKRKKIDILQKY